jgi:hypothetical protein
MDANEKQTVRAASRLKILLGGPQKGDDLRHLALSYGHDTT